MPKATVQDITTPAKLRTRMARAVEKLLDALDALDAQHEDLEDCDEDGEGDDREDDPAEMGIGDSGGLNTDDEDGGDDEPSLGSFDRMTDQSKAWRVHYGGDAGWACVDAEQDDADKEDNGDREQDDELL